MPGLLKRLLESPDLQRLRRLAATEHSPRAALDLCRKLLGRGRGEEAMAIAQAALLEFPHCRDLQDILRSTSKRHGRELRQGLIQQVSAHDVPETWEALIEHYLEFGELDAAGREADRLLAAQSEAAWALLLHGRTFLRRFQVEHVAQDGATALRSLQRAADKAPDAVEPRLELARALIYIGAVSEALFHLYRVQDCDPDHPGVSSLIERLLKLPVEGGGAGDLLRGIEENEGPLLPASGDEEQPARSRPLSVTEIQQGIESLSSMNGVGLVAFSHDSADLVARAGESGPPRDDIARRFHGLAVGFRRTASLSSKRMGIGAFQEAELDWIGGQLVAIAAGRQVLILQLEDISQKEPVSVEARLLVAAWAQRGGGSES